MAVILSVKVRVLLWSFHPSYLKHRTGTVMNWKNVRNVILAQLLYISGICSKGEKKEDIF